MKKIVISLVIAALLILTVGSIAMAQDDTPVFPGGRGPNGTGGGRGSMMGGPADGSGVMHDEMVAGIASALGISVEEFETRRDAGETMFEIAESLGIDFEQLTGVMNQVRAELMEQAYADGTLTQEQYQRFLDGGSNMGNHGGGRGGRGTGAFGGECPFADTDS